MKNNLYLYRSIYKTLPALLILFTIYTAVMPETARAQNQSASKTEADNQDLFGERFREGRDSIDRQAWAQAAEKFREAVEKYPDHKSADAAFYWLAFCYKKQKKYQQTDAALDRLLEKFPSSVWASDARVMKLEIAPWLGRRGVSGNDNINSDVVREQLSADLQEKIINGKGVSDQNTGAGDKLGIVERLPLDRADEIKIAAFQSLLTADPPRAIETTGEILKPDSKASENLKREILRIWRNPRVYASKKMTENTAQTNGSKELLPSLRETLVKGFRSEQNLKIQIEIIYTLASFADALSLEYLKNLYATEKRRDIRKDILNSLGVTANVFYAFSANIAPEQKGQPNPALEQARQAKADFLLEIFRTEKDAELRRLAFSNLRRFPNWRTNGQVVETITKFYDAETDEDSKISLIRALAELKQTAATRKLLDIAKNGQSDKLCLEAIYSLRNSKDPEAIKFLQDLIN